jgi:hypothetical protein
MEFIRTWFAGYYNPNKVIDKLRDKPAPQWGFYATVLRAGFDSLLLYLPLAILRRQPTTPSVLSFLSTEKYYWTSIFLVPFYLILLWLFLSALVHLILSLTKKESSFNQILNITGMTSLIVGAPLILADWFFIIMGWHFPMILGFVHMIFGFAGLAIIIIGYKKILQVPVWFGIILNIIWVLVAWPISAVFIRPPV